MSQHNDEISLRHMLDYAREAVAMVQGKVRADLDHDRMLELALVRLVEIVGEAAARVSPAGQERYSGLPWPQIIGTRHRLVHGYGKVDLNVLWDTVIDDLPPLIAALERIVDS
ncbi:MAG: HepT-like ribonuclease domain-containing protein [Phycisphaerae bacterium]